MGGSDANGTPAAGAASGRNGSARAPGRGSLAARADRHALYERAVQCPEAEVEFLAETFAALRARPARSLGEDFCGTAALCRAWVGRGGASTALGVDSDPRVLAWASQRLATLPAETAAQARLCEADVRATVAGGAGAGLDLITALNFSWWLISERDGLRRYFQQVRRRLAADGVFVLDAYGGYDAVREITEARAVEDDGSGAFTYIWEQADYDPVSGVMLCHIHFAFPDGSRLDRAFSYRWRLWTLPEVREVLAEAGFARVTVYWQGWDADGEPDGVFRPAARGTADAGWICYLSAEK